MTYATQADLEDAYGAAEVLQLADRDGDGSVDANVITAVLARADGVIDGYLGGRYAVPLPAPYPAIIVAVAAELARYWLFDDAAPERVRQGYDDALAWLRDVASGKAMLLGIPSADPATSVGSPDFDAPDRVFTAETLVDF